MQYRREIDGLRAVAVVPVILFHAGFTWFSGGYVGVDVFFVISGYLITSILLKDLLSGHFSIVTFYERRARRILPALTLVLLCTIPFAWLWFLPSQFQEFSKAVAATSLFASNILFWRDSDYFAPAAEENPLLHTWSLAVEEQFYIIFPIFLFLIWRCGKQVTLYGLIGLSILSLALSEYGWRNHPSANFYLLITRAWELGVGAICALYLLENQVKSNSYLSFLGLMLILFSVVYYDASTPFPSLYALVPVIGTALIIIFSGSKTIISRMLSLKLFVGIGLISYSAYLWHQPLFAFARIRTFGDPIPGLMLLLSAFSFFFAYLSWKFVEIPFRSGRVSFFNSRTKIFSLSAVSLVSLISFGAYGHLSDGASWRSVGVKVLEYEPDNKKLQRKSWDILKEVSGSESYAVEGNDVDSLRWSYGSESGVKLLLVGNSHSKDVFNVIFNSKYVENELQISRYGSQIYRLANKNHDLYKSENFKSSDVVMIVSQYRDEDIRVIGKVIDNITSFGKRVVISENIFEFPEFGGARTLADFVIHKVKDKKDLESDSDIVASLVNNEYYSVYMSGNTGDLVKASNRIISSFKDNVLILDRMNYVCSAPREQCFAINSEYEKFFYDYGHHTLEGAEFFGSRLADVRWLDPLLEEDARVVVGER
ncbi:acyltransferase family protein [Marinobacter salarius]|uniref:acyltransferase family protein n=1 Tax=Marinobacter salarius TaxID=1420917 RepID=UPI000F854AAA|nr:acyltransferase family protein [Marinobacter salarius]AZR42383.1 putative O-acetyltransferase [Marinobacter salarius]